MRRSKTLDDRLFDLALQHWLDWLLAFYAPRRRNHRVPITTEVYEAQAANIKGNTEHSDAVLARLLSEERAGYDWPASIHAIVLDLPATWQLALLGTAMGYSQEAIGREVGVCQQRVSVLLSLIRSRFIPRLMLVAATDRVCRQILGRGVSPAANDRRLRIA